MVATCITLCYGIIVDAQFIQDRLGWSCEQNHEGEPHDEQCLDEAIYDLIYGEGIKGFSSHVLSHDDAEYYWAGTEGGGRRRSLYVIGIDIVAINIGRGSQGSYPILSEKEIKAAKHKFQVAFERSPFSEAGVVPTHKPAIIMVKNGCSCCS